jgi:5-methylcytosine-specific restriction endonuclease McrA
MGDVVDRQRKNTASQAQLRSLIEKQQFCCALTGVSLTPDDAQLDHIIAITNGGTNSIDNLQVVHKVINKMKNTMTNREFVTWCRIVASHADILSGSLEE